MSVTYNRHDRYSVEVSDGYAVIHGELSIKEAIDLLLYFDKQGFDLITHGDENSALCLIKKVILKEHNGLAETS